MNNTNTWYANLLILLFILPMSDFGKQQDDGWDFKKDRYGIKIYTRESEGTNIKELKFTVTIEATMNQVATLLTDVDNYSSWVYACDQSTTIDELNPLVSYCYYRVDFPWPMSDRDLVVYSEVKQDPTTKVLTSDTYSRSDYMPKEVGYIRITDHFNKWIFTPISSSQIEVTYLLKSDPGGSIPVWAINMAIDQGPVKSMKGFIENLKKEKYVNARFEGIVDY